MGPARQVPESRTGLTIFFYNLKKIPQSPRLKFATQMASAGAVC